MFSQGHRRQEGKADSRFPYRRKHSCPRKGKLQSHDNILVKAYFRQFTGRRKSTTVLKCSVSRLNTHQVQVVKYFRGFVHLCHGDQNLIVDVFLVGSHIKPYSYLQGRVHLPQESLHTLTSILFLICRLYFSLPSSLVYICPQLTILEVRLSKSSVLITSLKCSLISLSLDILSAELPVQGNMKTGLYEHTSTTFIYFMLLCM